MEVGEHVAEDVVVRGGVEVGEAGADGGERGVDVGVGAGEVGEGSEGANCVCCDATVANCYTHTKLEKEKLLRRS